VDGPPSLPGPGRRSLAPASLRSLPSIVGDTAGWLAEVGVGVVHCDAAAADRLRPDEGPSRSVVELHRRIKENFDPPGRLNPGRQVLTGAVP
jgi:hypothetical protein